MCYFNKTSVLNGSIGSMGDVAARVCVPQAYGQDKEGIFINVNQLPPDVKFVFILVNNRTGSPLSAAGAQVLKSKPPLNFIVSPELDCIASLSLLRAVTRAIRPSSLPSCVYSSFKSNSKTWYFGFLLGSSDSRMAPNLVVTFCTTCR